MRDYLLVTPAAIYNKLVWADLLKMLHMQALCSKGQTKLGLLSGLWIALPLKYRFTVVRLKKTLLPF